jgi:(p)ppGpp synthase/HD superfamily hydrolase
VSLVDDARGLAERAHAGQRRKGGDKPYIGHPSAVAAEVARHGGGEELVAAAWLHDVVEDTDLRLDELRAHVGERVALLVDAVTEHDKRLPWEERKRQALDHLASADPDVALLKGCDTLANARDILADLRAGEDVWARFSRPRSQQLWWYCSVARLVRERLPGHPLAAELTAAVDEVCLVATAG